MARHHIETARAASFACLALLSLCAARAHAADSQALDRILDGLNSVHPFSEVALSPDGKRLVYGNVVTGKRSGADVDVSALWIVDARDGSAPTRLTACPGSVCDEHGAAWSADGKHIAFVTTGADEQAQIVSADAAGGNITALTQAHGPVDTPRFSPDGTRIAFLYSEGAPKQPGPLNPLDRDAGVLSSTIYEQRLAVVPARGGVIAVLGPADLNIYEYDWSPDGTNFVVTAAHGSGDNNWWLAELDIMDTRNGAVRTLLKPPRCR